MSLLDDLKKQAQEKSVKSAESDKNTLQNTERNWHILAPKQHIIYNYFKEVAESLNVLNLQERNNYNLTKQVVFNNLLKREFRIYRPDKDSLKSFAFKYDLVGERDIQIAFSNAAQAEKIRGILSERGFRFVDKTESPTRILFYVKPKIVTSFEYMGDLENCCILLKIDNFEGAWSQMIRYAPDAINEKLLEETVKYILGNPNQFQQLSGNQVSEDMRAKLREKLQKDGKIPRQEKIEQMPEDKLDSTTIRLKNLFKR